MAIIYCNGYFASLDKPYCPDSDYGVYTTILLEDAKVYFLEEHLRRLSMHAKKLTLEKTINKNELLQLIEKNKAMKGKWRIRVMITAKMVLATIQKEENLQADKISLCTYQKPWISANSQLKTLATFNRLKLLKHANEKGFSDCITFDENKNILETSIANIFWIKDNMFYYPDSKLNYLKGITLSFAIDVARKMGLIVQSGAYKLSQLEDADVFYCNSMKKVLPVIRVENVKYLKNSVTQIEFIHHFCSMAKAHSTCFALKTQKS